MKWLVIRCHHKLLAIHADLRRIRLTSANPTQMLRAPAARGACNKGCYFWTPRVCVPDENTDEFFTEAQEPLFLREM
jgi:hypothetical protein